MISSPRRTQSEPILHRVRAPVFATTVIIGLHALALLTTTLIAAFGGSSSAVADPLVYSTREVFIQGRIWQFFTYAFVHQPSLFLLVEFGLFYLIGREVEKVFGRRGFVLLYLILLLGPPCALTFYAFVARALPGLAFPHVAYSGSFLLHAGVFLVYAFARPDAPLIGRLSSGWLAAGTFFLLAMQALRYHDQATLASLGLTAVLAFFCTRSVPIPPRVDLLEQIRERTDRRREIRSMRRGRNSIPPEEELTGEWQEADVSEVDVPPENAIDLILEKIARDGMTSLTADERDLLERARHDMLKRDGGHAPVNDLE